MKACLATLVLAVGLFCTWGYAKPNAVDAFDPGKFEEYKAKAEQGDARGQALLGRCYATGQGVEKNSAEAVKWLSKAAEQNHPEAQFYLGCCYLQGRGVVQDEVEAYKWYLLAAAQGHEHAKDDAPLLEMLLTPDQIAEGKRRAGNFKPQERTQP